MLARKNVNENTIWSWNNSPSGTDTLALQIWLLRFDTSLAILRKDMEVWTNWLSNDSPPWAAYWAIIAARLVALDKFPGVRAVGIREVCRRLIFNIVLRSGGVQAKEACGSVNLCASLDAGIEGAINTVRELEELGRGETVEERWERLETEDQARLIFELAPNR